jgi:hypothetical protein
LFKKLWSSGAVSARGVKGREIDSRQGICRVVALRRKNETLRSPKVSIAVRIKTGALAGFDRTTLAMKLLPTNLQSFCSSSSTDQGSYIIFGNFDLFLVRKLAAFLGKQLVVFMYCCFLSPIRQHCCYCLNYKHHNTTPNNALQVCYPTTRFKLSYAMK